MSKDSAAIRDQLGNDPDTTFVLNADYSETIGIEELATVINTKTYGHVWIVGTPTNSIVGAWTGTEDGEQLVVGSGTDSTDGRVSTLHRVVNPNNTFNEHFRDDDFKDASLQNTAYWDTSNYRLAMKSTAKTGMVFSTVANFSSIFYNQVTITKVKISATETKYGSDAIAYQASADAGNTWNTVTKNTWYNFTTSGQDLRIRIIFTGIGCNETYLEDLRVEYA